MPLNSQHESESVPTTCPATSSFKSALSVTALTRFALLLQLGQVVLVAVVVSVLLVMSVITRPFSVLPTLLSES